MIVTEEDALLVRTMLATIRDQYDVHAFDDPDALDDLLFDAAVLLNRMTAELPDTPIFVGDTDEGVPL